MRNSLKLSVIVLAGVLLAGVAAFGQDGRVYGTREKSQAEKEAERLATLSAEQIISILAKEPGLMLQFKRDLVRMVYSEGRILDADEFTDEAAFRLLREDVNVRRIATKEIENRNYVRPKPTQEEIERLRQLREYYGVYLEPEKSATELGPNGQPVKSKNQEEEYWKKHERDTEMPLLPTLQRNADGTYSSATTMNGPLSPNDTTTLPTGRTMTPAAPSAPASRSRERELNRASLEDNPYELMTPDTSRMARVGTPDMTDMISAAAAARAGGSMGGLDAVVSEADFAPDRARAAASAGLGGSGAQISRDGADPRDLLRRQGESRQAQGSQQQLRQQASLDRRGYEYPRATDLYPEAAPDMYPNQLMKRKPNPYADVPALFDLNKQVARRQPTLERFGINVFTDGTGNYDDLPMDMPVGPEYILGPGDIVNVEMTGSTAQRAQRTVDREGRIALNEAGMVLVAGRSLGDAQRAVQAALRTQFRDVNVDLSLARLRTVRVYVAGDVVRPGAYDISALSTPLNAVFAAGGVTAKGSMRNIAHMRGDKLIEQFDAYDVLLRGARAEVKPLGPGDTIIVKPLTAQVTVEGMVRRPAVYEINGEQSLAEVLELAGGVMSTGTLRHLSVERLVAHEKREMQPIDIPETNTDAAVNKILAEFKVQDGDHIRVAPIPPGTQNTLYIDGHVYTPGKYAFKPGSKISDVVKPSDLLPEPYYKHGEIIRLNPPDYQPQVIAFNLGEALAHGNADLPLQPLDTVRVYGRFDFEDPPVVTVTGEVREPGDHRTNGVTHVSDAVFLAGGLTQEAAPDDVQIVRKVESNRMKVISVNLRKALAGDPTENVVLQPMDRVLISRDLAKTSPAAVTIAGEVGKPGKYPMSNGMTALELIKLAGGLTRGANTQSADLTRFEVREGQKLQGVEQPIELAKLLGGDATADVPLRDGDVLTIRQVTGWQDRGAFITVKGEVIHPGGYGIREGERLSSILKRAGGFRAGAYPYGAVFIREQVRDAEEHTRLELIRRVQAQETSLKVLPDNPRIVDFTLARDAAIAQWEVTLDKLKTTPPTGRMVIHISSDIKHWENTAADIEVRAGDIITVPKKPSFVMVTGAVFTPNAVSYRGGHSAAWYLGQAGGPTQQANRKSAYVVRADGSIIGGGERILGLFSGSMHTISLQPGDMVVVPEKAIGGPTPWQTIFSGAQAFSSLAFAVNVLTQ